MKTIQQGPAISHDSVLIIGSGGREHALARAVQGSERVAKIFCAPGNGGMGSVGDCVPLNLKDHAAVAAFVERERIKLTLIGPEAPLVEGLADFLRGRTHLVLGASRSAAQLEGSKIFAKNFMVKHGIPTAAFRVFDSADAAQSFVNSPEGERFMVLKADGLAAGKGVIVAKTKAELLQAIQDIMVDRKFGGAGDRILLEETLSGQEISIIALIDGKTILPFPASQDHKRAFDGDQGPNTGGMGAYAPTPFYDGTVRKTVEKDIMAGFLRGIQAENLDFRGVIYFGLMLTPTGPKVLEFNVRFGDPETQVILPLVDSDLYQAFLATAQGTLANIGFHIKPAFACTVVMASKGYPGAYETGFPITGLDEAEEDGQVMVFHAGTKKEGDQILTAGGRVLNVTGLGRTLETAVVRTYQGVKKIKFEQSFYRTDIASKALLQPC